MSTLPRALVRPLTLALLGALAITMLPGGTARPVAAVSPNLVISQVYGGGGGTGASFTNDFVELFNRGTSAVSLTGMSVQYASAAGTGNFGTNPVAPLSGMVAAGGYYLVQLAGGATGAALPTPDATGTVNMSGTAGKVALADSTVGLACNGGSTPCSAAQLALIRDLVGYGTTANFYEGSAPAPAPSTTTSVSRNLGGCTDTDQNGSDFSAGIPVPRNTASPLSPCPGGDTAPSVSSSTPADGATNVAVNASLSVTFSEQVVVAAGAISLTCGGVGKTIGVSGDPGTTFDLTYLPPLPAGAVCEIAISGAGIADTDTNDPPDTMAANVTIDFTVVTPDPCATSDTPIGAIQGSGDISPLAGSNVTIQGIVTGDYEYGGGATGNYLRGFYIGDAGDGEAATSDGIFVFNGNANGVDLGDVVQVSGAVAEFQGQTQLSSPSIVDCATSGTVTPTDISFPVADATSLERYEGMLVRVPETMTVTEHFQLGRFGQVVISSDGRLDSPTAVVAPGDPALELQAQNNLRKVIVDDASQAQNPDPIVFGRGGNPLSASNTLRGGDTITNLTGVMTYTWAGNAASGNAYRIRPGNALGGSATFVAENGRPGAATVDGDVRVAAMNLLNYFNTFIGCTQGAGGIATGCRGAENQVEFDRQVPKTVAAILGLDAAVVGINEVENDGYGPSSAIAHLVDQLNLAAGADTYAFIDVDAETGQVNALGDDAIKVGLIYRPAAVTPVGDTAALNTPAFVLGGDAPPAPPLPQLRSRPSLAQAFETGDGARFVVDVNHLKSKGSPCDAPSDAGDGQGNCNTVRTNGATELAAWLATDPTGTGDEDVLIMGDLNSYAKEDPITVLTDAGYENLVTAFVDGTPYSYVFDGQWGYLDYALGSAAAADEVVDVLEWHIDADEPAVLDYNTNFKSPGQLTSLYAPDRFRVSDHDPIVVGLDPVNDPPVIDAGGPHTVVEGATTVISATATDPEGTAVTIAWDLEQDGTFEVAGSQATIDATALDAPATILVDVRATDAWGHASVATVAIDVVWDFGGFGPPAAGGSVEAKAGASVPVKFSLGGDQGPDVLDGTPTYQRWDCVTLEPIGSVATATLSEPLTYDPSRDEYKLVWKTAKGWAQSCATLTVALDDGQSYELEVRFTK